VASSACHREPTSSEAGALAGSAAWVSFLIAGLISSLLGYAVVKLGVRIRHPAGSSPTSSEGGEDTGADHRSDTEKDRSADRHLLRGRWVGRRGRRAHEGRAIVLRRVRHLARLHDGQGVGIAHARGGALDGGGPPPDAPGPPVASLGELSFRPRRIRLIIQIAAPTTTPPIRAQAHPSSPLDSEDGSFFAAAAPAAAAAGAWLVDVVVVVVGAVVVSVLTTVVVCVGAVTVVVFGGDVTVWV